jgi:hypothetical protein
VGAPGGGASAREAVEIAERIGSVVSRVHAWFYVGLGEHLRGHWPHAIEAIERAEAIARERGSGVESRAERLARLGEAHLGLGDPQRARALVEEAARTAHRQAQVINEIDASLALARVLLGSAGPAARAEIEAALARALALVEQTGAKAFEPQVQVELAELARQTGDGEAHGRQLRHAHHLFTEIGATGHAERLAATLATSTR